MHDLTMALLQAETLSNKTLCGVLPLSMFAPSPAPPCVTFTQKKIIYVIDTSMNCTDRLLQFQYTKLLVKTLQATKLL